MTMALYLSNILNECSMSKDILHMLLMGNVKFEGHLHVSRWCALHRAAAVVNCHWGRNERN